MIFENALSDHDEPSDIKSASLNLSQSATSATRTSPKTPSVDQQKSTNITRARQRSLPLSTSPPPVINPPQSVRKPERIYRQGSVPARKPVTILQQQSLPSQLPTQGRNYILYIHLYSKVNILKFYSFSERADVAANNQWQSVQQPYFTPENLSNVIETAQENQDHKTRALSDKGE
jgi:hypothetical protein